MIGRFHRPPDGQFGGRCGKRAPLVTAGQDLQASMHVSYCFLQGCRHDPAFFDAEHIVQCLVPRSVPVGPPPRGKLGSKRPHGPGQASKPETFFTEFEQLCVAERGVVLLFVNPVFLEQPLDETLSVALGNHANGSKCCVEPWNFARADHQREGAEDGPTRMRHR